MAHRDERLGRQGKVRQDAPGGSDLDLDLHQLITETRDCLERIHTTLDQLDKLLAERWRGVAGESRPRPRIRYGGGQSSLASRELLRRPQSESADRAQSESADRPQSESADRPHTDAPDRPRPELPHWAPDAQHEARQRDPEPERSRLTTTDLLAAIELTQSRLSRQELSERLRARFGRDTADQLMDSL
jgi:hypothetical protein